MDNNRNFVSYRFSNQYWALGHPTTDTENPKAIHRPRPPMPVRAQALSGNTGGAKQRAAGDGEAVLQEAIAARSTAGAKGIDACRRLPLRTTARFGRNSSVPYRHEFQAGHRDGPG